MLSTEVCFNPSVYFLITHTTLWSFPLINSRSLFIPPCPTLVLASNIFTFLTSSPSLQAQFISITNHYHIRHNSPHTHPIFFPFIVFECRHNIQPVSTAIPSPNSFRNITKIETHQHFGKILKDIFFDFSPRQYGAPTNKAHRQALLALIFIFTYIRKFFIFIINPRILSFSQIVFSFHPMQDPSTWASHNNCPPSPPIILPFSSPPSLIRIQHLHYILFTFSSKLLSNKFSLLIICLRILS